ncbi:hypothetical protein K457DRAFT_558344 [Linnemannia elongata AG-77]|uniref:Uncharacterized protein n=1 Tax=Linnemannia elongata AG-77 TaxID=1314771 RepID=A0A197JTL1_9FUNG|nr:hypothetical protein K457DRAFT_558344 [Linnemannia elongata AG-77]
MTTTVKLRLKREEKEGQRNKTFGLPFLPLFSTNLFASSLFFLPRLAFRAGIHKHDEQVPQQVSMQRKRGDANGKGKTECSTMMGQHPLTRVEGHGAAVDKQWKQEEQDGKM